MARDSAVRQTLARLFGDKYQTIYFDLESIPDQRRLQNPELMLGSLNGLVILDEIQLMPEFFSALPAKLHLFVDTNRVKSHKDHASAYHIELFDDIWTR